MHSQDKTPVPETNPGAMPGRSELRFLLPEERTNFGRVFSGAGLAHAAFVLLIVAAVALRPVREVRAPQLEFETTDLVFLQELGPGGGGGGGGNESPEPPRTAELPAVKAPEPEPIPVPEPDPVPEPEPEPEPEVIAAEIPAISPVDVPAVVSNSAVNMASASLGTGRDTGAGTGSGGGIGEGRGDGLGEGEGGNFGGGVRQIGNGVLPPVDIYKEKPAYTSEAMLRRIQGTVALDCVVLATGAVGNCKVAKTLDSNVYGLDDQALKAARNFRFRPARVAASGEAVAVLVRIELDFNMR